MLSANPQQAVMVIGMSVAQFDMLVKLNQREQMN